MRTGSTRFQRPLWYRHRARWRRTLPVVREWHRRAHETCAPSVRCVPTLCAPEVCAPSDSREGSTYHSPGYALPTCHAALGPGCKRSLWRRLPACVEASSPLPSGAGRGRWCTGTNLVQQHVYAQVSHACLTDSMIGTIPSSTSVTRMGNGMPRAGSRARLLRQHGCRTPNCATRA
ncbi:MAG: hypothetical protein KatS3mg056_3130 [Chloroflexus sp.]|nr:MAG: hypothetical protein KatS3mg056_3130 [Chloroflexus sp.]